MDNGNSEMEVSPLFRISGELRNIIYQYALQSPKEPDLFSQEAPLTRTCRKIRRECLLLYYTCNSFGLNIPSDSALAIGRRLEASHLADSRGIDKVKAIPRVTVHYSLSTAEQMLFLAGQLAGNYIRPGWVELGASLARMGFREEQIEWRSEVSSFSHPSRGGNYYHYLAESARSKLVEERMQQDWHKAVEQREEASRSS